MAKEDLLTAAKVAEKLGVPKGKVDKAIKENSIEPDAKKGPCKYFGPKTVARIKKLIQ